MSVILDFYRGNLRPIEEISYPSEKVYLDLVEDMQRVESELIDSFTEKQKQLFKTIGDSRNTLSSMEQENTFVFGFKLGIRFGEELFKSDNEEY